MSFWIPARSRREEIMDRSDNTRDALGAALRDIRWTNRWLGGARVWLDGLTAYETTPEDGRPLRLLDVGTGEADLPRTWVDRARRAGRSVQVVALDADPATVEVATDACRDYPEITVVRDDAFALPYDARSFDLVSASMFLHHFGETDVVELLRGFLRVSSRAVVVHDLFRHRLPWAFIGAVGWGTWRSSMYRHDAPLSVLRGFTASEFEGLCAQSEPARAVVESRWPFRVLARLEPEAPA
ncbi:MAG: methyltransferase domain-containing protein [Planctomycetota bacterium]|nr:methyltransferase domain-containing protein [Planctomycetota bacterium]